MNAVEIEEAVSALAGAPFGRGEFPYAFLAAFGNKDTTIKRLRAGSSNASDVPGGVLQRNNIHVATCAPGEVASTLAALRASPKTGAAKAKFVLATDGDEFQAEDLVSGEVVACRYPDFAKHFGLFLPLAGISTVRQIANNPIDIKATGRLNKLYVELLKDNEDWGIEACGGFRIIRSSNTSTIEKPPLLFLDDLRGSLEAADTNVRKLKNLRRRIASIRVFDPACDSGNFLVIAYKQMREIEAVIVKRLDDNPRSWIKLDNFFGIDIKDFAVEIARLSLLIAEFQSDERLIGQREARLNVLPLHISKKSSDRHFDFCRNHSMARFGTRLPC
jgi:hypothetical protein